MNQSLELTDPQLASLRTAAASGNGAAAYQIALYYAYVAFDEKKHLFWLERAAKLGYVPAMESLGNLLIESPRREDRVRGQKLLEQVRGERNRARQTVNFQRHRLI